MIRKTLTILSLIGLLLSVGLWGLSLFLQVHCIPTPSGPGISLGPGWLKLGFTGLPPESPLPEDYETWSVWRRDRTFDPDTVTIKTGWRAWRADRSLILWRPTFINDWPNKASVILPFWIPTLLFGVWPVWLLLPFHRRRKRKKLGLCVKCGYDLRASKDRCPECGLSLEKRKTKGESTCEQEC